MECSICGSKTSNDDSLCSDDCRIEMSQQRDFEEFSGKK